MKAEIDALKLNETWPFADLPSVKKPIGCKWVYKLKFNARGEIDDTRRDL